METQRIRYIYEIKNLVNEKTYIGQHTLREGCHAGEKNSQYGKKQSEETKRKKREARQRRHEKLFSSIKQYIEQLGLEKISMKDKVEIGKKFNCSYKTVERVLISN